jgi:hypothetical protein
MYKETNLYNFFIRLFLSLFFFIFLSLYFSVQKISLVFLFSIIFFFLRFNHKKIILINLIVFSLLLKIVIIPFQNKNTSIDPSRTVIYEKNFLYGIKNLNLKYEAFNGDLSSLEESFKKKYYNLNKKRTINIFTDHLGFRNTIKPNEANYIFVGDSFLQLGNLTQDNILNFVLNNYFGLKTYNAGVGATDISHYFETIKFFKDKLKLKNKKYIMLIFQGNDFLNYQVEKKNNYHKYIDNQFLHYYFKFKIFFNFYPLIKYVLHNFNEEEKDFVQVYEFKIKKKDVLFKFDYIYKDGQKINSLNDIFKKYKDYLPDSIIFIPTKFEIYCEFIVNKKCPKTEHFSVLKNEPLLSGVKLLNSKDFFKKKAAELINSENKLIYGIDDTHLNKIGVKYLSEFIFINLEK